MPDPRELAAEMHLAFAEQLADAAGAAIRPWFRADASVELKGDGTPVTAADRAAEIAIRERIADPHPSHGIVGEEFGSEQVDAEWVWVIDPIDGTGAFVSGLPTFTTLIGLCHEGSPILGLLDQVILGERWSGVDLPGVLRRTTHNSQVIHSSGQQVSGRVNCLRDQSGDVPGGGASRLGAAVGVSRTDSLRN